MSHLFPAMTLTDEVAMEGTFILQKESWVSEKEVMCPLSHGWLIMEPSLESMVPVNIFLLSGVLFT